MAASDAKPIAIKNSAYRVTFPIFDADGDLVTAAAALDSEISKDGATFADATNEATEIATGSGMYFLDLTAAEMNADTIAIIIKTSTAGAKTTPIVIYPATSDGSEMPVNAKQISDSTAAADNVEANITNLDATVSSRATPAQVNTEVDNALDTVIPVTPTTDSINDKVKNLLSNADHKDRLNVPAVISAVKGGKEVLTQIKYGNGVNQAIVDYTYDNNDGSLLTGTVQ